MHNKIKKDGMKLIRKYWTFSNERWHRSNKGYSKKDTDRRNNEEQKRIKEKDGSNAHGDESLVRNKSSFEPTKQKQPKRCTKSNVILVLKNVSALKTYKMINEL